MNQTSVKSCLGLPALFLLIDTPFAETWRGRVVAIRRAYHLAIDWRETVALERILAACESAAMGPLECHADTAPERVSWKRTQGQSRGDYRERDGDWPGTVAATTYTNTPIPRLSSDCRVIGLFPLA